MKIRIPSQFLIFIVLMISACVQVTQAKPGADENSRATQMNSLVMDKTVLEVRIEAKLGQDIDGKCIRNSDKKRLLINSVQGYCLQYPPEYDVFVGYPSESETILFKISVMNTIEPSVSIKVAPAGGLTLEQAADQIAQVYAIPGTEPIRESLTMDGEAAIMLGGLSGQDPNRQVLVQHNDQLYSLFFIEFSKSDPEYAHFEKLYNTVIRSFNFNPETNACPGCPLDSGTEADQTREDPGSAMISGWVWHDLCDSGQDGEPAKTETPEGCVEEVSALGNYHADGLMAIREPLIEGAVVMLGEGLCPSTGMAEFSTLTTGLSYSFSGLKAGTYCVSIDPQREPNFTLLRPGQWTFPAIEQGVISTTVTLDPGEYRGMVNFGWDYQFQP